MAVLIITFAQGLPFDTSDLFLNNSGPPQSQTPSPPNHRSTSITDDSAARSVTPGSFPPSQEAFPSPAPLNVSPLPPSAEANGKLKKQRKADRERERDPPRDPPRESIELGSQGRPEDRPPRPSREVTRDRERGGDRERNRERGNDVERERDRDRTPQVPTLEAEMKRVLKECADAQAKARLLTENVTSAGPDDVETDSDGVIQVRSNLFRLPIRRS